MLLIYFLKNPGSCSSKVPRLCGPFSGATIRFIPFGTPRFSAINFRNLLAFSCIKNMLKSQLLKTSGLQFDNWPFGREEPFIRLPPIYSVKLVFSFVVKGIKINLTAKFRASRRLRFKDTKRIMSPEMRQKNLKKCRDFRETGPRAETFHVANEMFVTSWSR